MAVIIDIMNERGKEEISEKKREKKKESSTTNCAVHERKLFQWWWIERNLALLCRTRHERGKWTSCNPRRAELEKRSNYLARNACIDREHNFLPTRKKKERNAEKEEREEEGEERKRGLPLKESKFDDLNSIQSRWIVSIIEYSILNFSKFLNSIKIVSKRKK